MPSILYPNIFPHINSNYIHHLNDWKTAKMTKPGHFFQKTTQNSHQSSKLQKKSGRKWDLYIKGSPTLSFPLICCGDVWKQLQKIFLPREDWDVMWKYNFMVGSNKNHLEQQIQVSEWVGLGFRGGGTLGWLTAPTPCRRLGCPNLRNLSAS